MRSTFTAHSVLAAGLALLVSGALGAQSFSTAPSAAGAAPKPTRTGSLLGCGTEVLTQSTSQAITALNSVSCNAGGLHADNSYYRAFSLAAFPGGFNVCAVEFGVETATGAGGSQPVTLNVYANTGAAFPAGTWEANLIATQNIALADQSATIFNQALAASLPAGTTELVFEVFTPDGQTAGHAFFIGSNAGGESAPSYIEAADCGLTAPATTGSIGFPQMQIVMNVLGDPGGSALSMGAILEADSCASNPANNNGVIEPGETVDLTIPLEASGGDFTNVVGTLTSPTPGVTVTSGMGAYGNITSGNSANAVYTIVIDETAGCLSALDLQLAVTSTEENFNFPIARQVGQQAGGVYNGLPAAIPDNNPAGVAVTADISGHTGPITSVQVQVNATHTWVGDVTLELTSPEGTTITLLDRPGVPATMFGCNNEDINVLFADGQGDPEGLCGPSDTAWPVTDAAPVIPLSSFVGENANGTWTLTAFDAAGGDTGTVVDWELFIEPAAADVCEVCIGIDAPSALEIPTVDILGLVLLAMLIAGAGFWVSRRQTSA